MEEKDEFKQTDPYSQDILDALAVFDSVVKIEISLGMGALKRSASVNVRDVRSYCDMVGISNKEDIMFYAAKQCQLELNDILDEMDTKINKNG